MVYYTYGGYIITRGKFDDGSKWESIKMFVGKSYSKDEEPKSVAILKVDKKLMDFVAGLEKGCKLSLSFDENGKVIGITYIN